MAALKSWLQEMLATEIGFALPWCRSVVTTAMPRGDARRDVAARGSAAATAQSLEWVVASTSLRAAV